MIKKILLLSFLILGFTTNSWANFNFNNNCVKAYEAIFDLRLAEAKVLIQNEKKQNPDNGIIVLLESYVDYFSLLASENMGEYERFKNLKSARLSALEKQDRKSPYYLFTQAEINLQSGMVKSRFQDFFSSGLDVKKAYNLLKENASKFPSFLPNKKSSGLIEVIFGSIPSNLKGLASTFGFKGNVNTGIRTLENLTYALKKTPYAFYSDEVVFFLCYIETDLVHNKANYKRTMNYISTMNSSSLLRSYLQAYVSYRNAHNDDAIDYLLKVPKGDEYLDFPKLNYLLGSAKLSRMDPDANVYLAAYLKDYNGINYVKDGYLKLAYHYYLKGDSKRYSAFLQLVKSQGHVYDEKDKQALKEANDVSPDADLLRARLYFDGGYYEKALAELSNKTTIDFKIQRDQIEFNYRLGRIYDESGNDSAALVNYQKSINLGRSTSYYFSANAALSMGTIYEKKNDPSRAAVFYKQAIAMKNHEYENSIETKAKEGLRRIGY